MSASRWRSLRRPGCALDRANDRRIGSAAAEVGLGLAERALDLGDRGARHPAEEIDRGDDHAVLAVAALGYLLVDPGLLNRVQLAVAVQPGKALERRDLALHRAEGCAARPDLAAVLED